MYGVIWNIFLVGSVSILSYGCVALYDKELADSIVNTISWNSVRSYHYLNLKCNKIKKQLTDISSNKIVKNIKHQKNYKINSKSKILPENKKTFIGHKISDNSKFTKNLENLKDNDYFKDTDFDLMLVKEEEENDFKYLVIDNKNNIYDEITLVSKPFLQVEIEQNNTKIEIHEYLNKFYTNNSKILSKKFLSWYLPKFYNINLDPNYKLHFIDTNINIFTCNSDNHILLFDNADESYKLN